MRVFSLFVILLLGLTPVSARAGMARGAVAGRMGVRHRGFDRFQMMLPSEKAANLNMHESGELDGDDEVSAPTASRCSGTPNSETENPKPSRCSVQRKQTARLALEQDVHAPDKYRVLGPLTQYGEFAKAYQCSDKAIMNPPNRCGKGFGPVW